MTTEEINEQPRIEVQEALAEIALVQAEGGWRDFTEQMRDIKRTESYKEVGYRHFGSYYRERWQERTGRTLTTVQTCFQGLAALEEMEAVTNYEHARNSYPGYTEARILRSAIPDPVERVEVWDEYVASGRPIGQNRAGLRESIAESKGEPTVRDVLKAEDMADVPSAEFDRFENWASETSKLVGPISRMRPEEVADACERLYPEKIERHIAWADELARWYGAYRDELVSRQRQGIRAVK